MRKLSTLYYLAYAGACFAAAQPHPPSHEPHSSIRFEAVKGIHLYTGVEALLLEVAQDDLPIANLTTLPTTPAAQTTYTQQPFHYHPNWGWGFRVKAGYHLDHDLWDLEATYTRFYHHTKQTVLTRPDYFLFSGAQTNLNTGFNATPVDAVFFQYGTQFNQWDITQARTFAVSNYLKLQPLFGLRNTLLGQSYKTTVASESTTLTSQASIHFWGMGVLGGVNTYWGLNRQFSLYGTLKLASLFGYYSPKLNDHIFFPQSTLIYEREHQKSSKTCLDLALGAQWDKTFYQDRLHLQAHIGFEQYTYFNMNKSFYSYLQADQSNGLCGRDFTLQGFSFGLRADY
jgi:hypothetical protein